MNGENDVITVGGNGGKTGTGWKVAVIVLVVMTVGLGGVLAWKMIGDGGKDGETVADTQKEDGDKVDSDEGTWKSFTTEHMKFTFDYPEDWTVTSKIETVPDAAATGKSGRYSTTVKSPLGLELELWEDYIGGIGGTCGGEEEEKKVSGFLRHEADVTDFDDLSVVSTIYAEKHQFEVMVSRLNDLGAGRQVTCGEALFHGYLNEHNDVDIDGGSFMWFRGMWDKITSDEEYDEAVKILASLRQE